MSGNTRYELAPLGRRGLAWLIDMTLGGLVAVTVIKVAGGERDLGAVWDLVVFKSVNGQVGQQLSAATNPGAAGLAAIRPVAGLLGIVTGLFVAAVAYRVVTNAKWGAGFGKTILGLQVVVDRGEPEQRVTDGRVSQVPGWAKAWKRWAVPQVSSLIPLPMTGLLGYLPALRDPRRRGLHDLAAGTVVIDLRAVVAPRASRDAVAGSGAQDFYLTLR
ncbi:MAG TPA: RDD family protein [Mycobacteriales bacterium]|nr:RDD family protein [Mycobacteriales bacterium]